MATFSVVYGSDGFTVSGSGGDGDTVAEFTLFTTGDKPQVFLVSAIGNCPHGGSHGGVIQANLLATQSIGGSQSGAMGFGFDATNGGQPVSSAGFNTFMTAPLTDVRFAVTQVNGTFDSTYDFVFVVKAI